jgi:2-(1,2-epoxy-1,2-dihydrophenyl)acetyl-CoA isomerase
MSEPLLFRVEDGVAWLVMNRPEARNAMNMEMRALYFKALEQCAEDEAIRAVVLTATGKGFCTGADLSSSRAAKGDASAHLGAMRNAMASPQKTIRARDLEKPIIAAVNGVAAGLGRTSRTRDLVIAADDARFIEARAARHRCRRRRRVPPAARGPAQGEGVVSATISRRPTRSGWAW